MSNVFKTFAGRICGIILPIPETFPIKSNLNQTITAMKKTSLVLFLIVLFAYFTPVFGQVQEDSTLKIGFVNLGVAINTSKEGQRSKKFLEAQATRTNQLLKEKEQNIIKTEQDLNNNIMLNNEAKEQKRAEIENMKNELREEITKAQQSLRQNEARHTTKILNDLVSIVQDIAKADEYDLVIEYNLKQTILFTKYELIDITDKVVNEYDKVQSIQ